MRAGRPWWRCCAGCVAEPRERATAERRTRRRGACAPAPPGPRGRPLGPERRQATPVREAAGRKARRPQGTERIVRDRDSRRPPPPNNAGKARDAPAAAYGPAVRESPARARRIREPPGFSPGEAQKGLVRMATTRGVRRLGGLLRAPPPWPAWPKARGQGGGGHRGRHRGCPVHHRTVCAPPSVPPSPQAPRRNDATLPRHSGPRRSR